MDNTDNPQSITPEPAWQAFLTAQCARTPIDGTVVSVLPFGAFVEVAEGVHGLLHISEWASPPEVGDDVSVRILQLDLDKRRVSLAPA